MTKAKRTEIARLKALVKKLKGRLAKFTTRRCLVCREPFTAGRADATTCSPRCRTRLHRKRQKRRRSQRV
jgi:hypothetical protein